MDFQINKKVKYVHKILCETEKIYQTILKHAHITDSEYVLLFSVLEMGEGCSQKDISKNTHISTKTLNSTVKKLKQQGIIELKPGKYPNMYIHLTPKGINYIKEKMLPVMETENKILENITDEDFENFVAIVTKYMNLFTKISKPDSDED